MFYLTRRAEFCAGHRLHNPAFSEEENRRTFGACNNPGGHGHNYVLEVTVKGRPDPRTGMVINLSDLKRFMEEEIISRVDHKNLNTDVPFLAGVIPTAENLAERFYRLLEKRLPGGIMHKVRLYESPRNFVDFGAEG